MTGRFRKANLVEQLQTGYCMVKDTKLDRQGNLFILCRQVISVVLTGLACTIFSLSQVSITYLKPSDLVYRNGILMLSNSAIIAFIGNCSIRENWSSLGFAVPISRYKCIVLHVAQLENNRKIWSVISKPRILHSKVTSHTHGTVNMVCCNFLHVKCSQDNTC